MFFVLSSYWEHYPNKVDYTTLLVNVMGLADTLVAFGLKILTSLCSLNFGKFDVQSIISALITYVFKTQSKIYDGVFCKKN